MNKLSLIAISAILLALPLNSYAAEIRTQDNTQIPTTIQLAQNPGDFKRNRGNRMEKLIQELDLTAEQAQEVREIQERSQAENEALYQQIPTLKQELQSLWASEADSQQIQQQQQQLQAIRQQIGQNRWEDLLEIRELLTPEQRSQMAELMAQRHRRGHR